MCSCYYNPNLSSIDTSFYDDWYSVSGEPCFTVEEPLNKKEFYTLFLGLSDFSATEWTLDYNKQFSIKIFSDYDSLDEYGKTILISPPDEIILEVNQFSNIISEAKNVEVMSDEEGVENITLSLEDKIVNIVLDNSGSMAWNDYYGKRYDIARRMVNRISSTYPGDVSYNLFQFGGKPFKLWMGANKGNSPYAENYEFSADKFSDVQNNFSGVRLVRKEDSSPISPLDGEVLFEGIANKYSDNDIALGASYFYKLFTFDSNGNFSDGVGVQVDGNLQVIPKGVSIFSSFFMNGSNIRIDGDVAHAWHFGKEKDSLSLVDDEVLDFTGNSDFIIFGQNKEWLNQGDVPVGNSGFRFDGVGSYLSTEETSTAYYKRNLSIIFWVKPFSFDKESPILCREQSGNIEWQIFIQQDTGLLQFEVNGSLVASASSELTLNEWNHIAITIDEDGLSNIYIDGSVSASFLAPLSNSESNGHILSGHNIVESTYFHGEITEISIHNTCRDIGYIILASEIDEATDRDNGDRLLVCEFFIPDNYDFEGGKVKILYNKNRAPSNEYDGIEVFFDNVSPGAYCVSFFDNFVQSSKYITKIFSQNSIGNYSHVFDSPEKTLLVPSFSDEARDKAILPEEDFVQPTITKIIESGSNILIEWEEIVTSNEDLQAIRIYYSEDDYPVLERNCSTGILAFDGNIDDTQFVMRNVFFDKKYFFSIHTIDKYGRFSQASYFSAQGGRTESLEEIPLLEADGISYEKIDENSVNIFWGDIIKEKYISCFLDEKVSFYAKVIDEFGITIDNEYLDVSLVVSGTYSLDSDSDIDIFIGEEEINNPNISSLYRYCFEDINDGILHGSIMATENIGLLKNIKNIDLILQIKLSTKNTDQSWEYLSQPLNIRFVNPVCVDIKNRDKKFITKKCSHILGVMDKKATFENKKYDGIYLGSSNPYAMRVYLDYKGGPVKPGLIADYKYEIKEIYYDKCQNNDTFSYAEDGEETKKIVLLNSPEIMVSEEDILDENENFTGAKKEVSYADFLFSIPEEDKAFIIYIKYDLYGFSFVKSHKIFFDSPVKIDILPFAPKSDGTSVAEQFAIVYLLDADDPDNKDNVQFLENISVKWALLPKNTGATRPIFSLETQPSNGMDEDGDVFSTTTESGVARNVFIGPVSDVGFVSVDDDGEYIYERHDLVVSCSYGDYSSKEEATIELPPVGYGFGETSTSFFLSEFEDVKQDLYSDGVSYAKMTISHNANVSTTKFSEGFRNRMDSLGKTIMPLSSGQSILVSSSDPELEIIWGDIEETIDPYSGVSYIDISTAFVSKGQAFIALANGDYTYVYFRIKSTKNNSIIGYDNSINNACSELFVSPYYEKYNNEIVVDLSCVALLDNSDIPILSLKSGGSFIQGLPPAIIVPHNPLRIDLVGKKVDGDLVESIKVDGISYNDLVMKATFSEGLLSGDVYAEVSVSNKSQQPINIQNGVINITNYLDEDLDSESQHSYGTVTLLPIVKSLDYDAKVYISLNYNGFNSKLCIEINGDAEDTTTDDSGIEQRSIFSNSFEYSDLSSAPSLSWVSGSPMAHPRGSAVAENIGSKIYVAGGIDGNKIVDFVEEYDFSTGAWTEKTPMLTARMMAQSVVYGNYIYVFGGIVYDPYSNEFSITRSVERYDTLGDVWETMVSMPEIDEGFVESSSYGICSGVAEEIEGIVYILCGIKYITKDTGFCKTNDRILKYNISGNSWSHSDVLDDEFNYQRIKPYCIIDNNCLLIGGGMSCNPVDGTSNFLTDAFSYNTISEEISSASRDFSSMPVFRYKQGFVQNGNDFYLLGGDDGQTSTLSLCEKMSKSYSTYPKWDYELLTDLPLGKNETGCMVVNYGGKNYLVCVGGVESGKRQGFVSINNIINTKKMFLNGKQSVDIFLSLKDSGGRTPSGNVLGVVSGYLQKADSIFESEDKIDNDFLQHRVYFEDNNITFVDGVAVASLLPRGDEYLDKIVEKISFESEESSIRYKIVLEVTILDENYYGKTNISFEKNADDFHFEESILFDAFCVSASSNIIKRSNNYVGFSILSDPLSQTKLPVLDCWSSDPWITYITNFTSSGSVDAQQALLDIESMEAYSPFGGSPLYDALISASYDLTSNETYSDNKIFFIFSDDNPNSSYYSKEDAIIAMNYINEYQKVPFVFLDLNIGNEIISSNKTDESQNKFFNYLSNKSFGQSITISDSSKENDIVLLLSGKAKGSMGYGSCVMTVDLGENISLESMSLVYNLFSNTGGKWQISTSLDGCNYELLPTKYYGNAIASFSKIYCRYIKIYADIYSGLSASNEEEYDDIPSPGIPSIEKIIVNYYPEKVDYIYMNENETSSEPSQIVLSVDSNDKYDDKKNIYIGVQKGKYSYDWNDFQSNSQPAREV